MATKKDLAANIAKKLSYLRNRDAILAVDSVIDYLKDELKKANRIELRGFGSLSVKPRKYVGQDKFYQVIYYRMAKTVRQELKK